MKHQKKIVLILVIIGFTLCTFGILMSSPTINAANDMYGLQFQRVKSLYVPASYHKDYKNAVSAGKSTLDKYNSVQSFVHTKDRYAFVLTNTERDKQLKTETNMIYIMCKKNDEWEHCKSIRKLSYGHANDMAYNPNDNTVAIVYRDVKNKGKVVFLDGTTFKEKKKIDTPYKYGAIAYDKSLKRYYLSRLDSSDGLYHYTVCENTISDKACKKDVFTSKRRMTGQGLGAANGYVYKTNFDAGKATLYQPGTFLGYYGGEIDIFKYDKSTDKYNHVRSIYFNSKQQGISNIGEIEGIDFSGDTPYILFNGNTIGNSDKDGYNTMGRVYTPIYTARNVNAKIHTKVKTNNKAAFTKSNIKANFSSSSPKIDKNIASARDGYTLSNIAINKPGTYTFKIKQNNTSSSNWKLDKSTKTATVKVWYCLGINNLTYTTTFSKGDSTFTNEFTYTPVEVPISVDIKTTKKDDSYKTPSTKATLYKDGNKVETVSASSGKYTFNKIKFTKKGTYKYEIKQKNSGTIKDGAYTNTIDSSTISLTITVTEGEIKLTQKTKYSKSSFTNKVSAHFDDVENNISVKIKTNKNDTSVPTPRTQATLTKRGKTISTVNSANDNYSFNVKVNTPGTHKYVIKQNTGTNGQGIYSYSLDKKSIYLTINAKIDGNKLVCKSVLSSNTFTNKVTANYDEINVPLNTRIYTEKSISSLPTPNTKAVFTSGSKSETVNNEGEYYNYTIKLKKPGTYTYKVKQKVISDTADFIYDIDSKTITYTIVVTTNSNGTLNYTLNTDSSNSFSNRISTNSNTNLSISVSVDTNHPQGVSIPVTQAVLYKNETEVKTVDSLKGKYTFTGISISEAGTYTYKIKQKQTGTVTEGKFVKEYDSSEIIVTITAIKDGDNLKTTIAYSKDLFTNKITCNYDEIIVPINTKISNEKDDSLITIPKTTASIYKDDIIISTKENNGNNYSFNVIISAPGSYTYEIKQDNPGIHKTDEYNYSIDNDTKTCIVTVKENNGVLSATTKYLYNDDTFENSYSNKYDAISVPLSIDIETEKKDSVSVPITTAVLMEDDEEVEESTSNNKKYTFDSLEFITKGTFVYTIKQNNPGTSTSGIYEYNLDDAVITVEIVITEENGKLKSTVNYDKTSFSNEVIVHYEPILIPLEVNINSTNPNNLAHETQMLISNEEKVLEKVIEQDSKYKTTKVSVSDEGNYVFKIRQKKPYTSVKNGVKRTLDSKVITATVKVTAENGVLKHTVTYDNNTFNNKFESTTSQDDKYATVPIDIDVYSNTQAVDGLNVEATMFEDNIPIETVSQENSTYSFDGLQLTAGKHNFTIKQTHVDNPDWEIDDEQLDLTVTVNEDLTYNVQFREDISSFTNVEINTVDPTAENPDSPEVVTGIPNTISGTNIILIVIGIISLLSGVYIMIVSTKKEKGISL